MTPKEFKKAIITIEKESLNELPLANYKGNIYVIDTPEKVIEAINELKKWPVIGFDTETRPSFRKGQVYNVSLIQLSTPKDTFLFRTNIIGYPIELINLLEDSEILKIGLSIHDDFHNLNKSIEIEPVGFIDLQKFVKDFKIVDSSLSKIYAILFGERISKGQRLSNWEAQELSEAQQSYAALDAYACLRIYDYLKKNKFKPKKSPYLTLPQDPETEQEKEICENEI